MDAMLTSREPARNGQRIDRRRDGIAGADATAISRPARTRVLV
jgi:hypothetical protein